MSPEAVVLIAWASVCLVPVVWVVRRIFADIAGVTRRSSDP